MKKYLSTTRGNYRLTSHKRRKLWFWILLSIIVIGLVLPWFISRTSAVLLYPIHATVSWLKDSDDTIPVYLRSRTELLKEIESLKTKAATEGGTQLTIEKLSEENSRLRSLVGISTSTDRLVAKVIASPNSLAYDFLQINQGVKYGVKVGAPVYSGLDTVIGVVVHVAEDYSFVELFTSPGFRSTAFVVGPNVFSILEGMGGGIARVHLPQGVAIKEGQLVLLPGVFDGVYGDIVSIENHPTQPEQYGYVAPPIAMSSIYYVSVDINVVQSKTTDEIESEIREVIRQKASLDNDVIDLINFGEDELGDEIATTTTPSMNNSATSSDSSVEE